MIDGSIQLDHRLYYYLWAAGERLGRVLINAQIRGLLSRSNRKTFAVLSLSAFDRFGPQRALQRAPSLRAGGTRSLRPAGQYAPRFRTIQVCPKDVGSACSHSPTRLGGGVRLEAAFKLREQIMFTHQRPLIRFEILAIISICGLLFVVAVREAGHQLWSIPAMTLFLLSGMMFVYALSKASRRLLQGPQETTLAVP
jgi:hypothetical protein